MRFIIYFCLFTLSLNALGGDSAKYKSYLDLNDDGVMDVSYIIKSGTKYELVDSNFDGKVDVINTLRSDQSIEFVHYDQNFDGWFESKDFMADGVVTRTEIDLVEGGVLDIVYIYSQTEVSCSARIYTNPNYYIEKIIYRFGVPEKRIRLKLNSLDSNDIKDKLINTCREI